MSGRSYPMFPRETLLQEGSSDTKYLSDTYDIQEANSFMLEIRPFAVAGTSPSITVGLQTSNTLHANETDWTEDLTTTTPITAGGGVPIRLVAPVGNAPLGKFARVRVTLTGTDVGFTFEVLGLARSG